MLGYGDEILRLFSLFLARTLWRRLCVVPGGFGCADLLADSLEVSVDGVAFGVVEALFVAFGWWLAVPGPNCRICSISKVGSDSSGEGDRREELAWGSKNASGGTVGWVVLAGDILCVEICPCGLDDFV